MPIHSHINPLHPLHPICLGITTTAPSDIKPTFPQWSPYFRCYDQNRFNPLNTELNPIRHLLALVGARHIVHVSRVRVKHSLPLPTLATCPTNYPP